MQIFPKTKCFCNKHGPFRKKLTLINKNYIYVPIKNSNFEYWVLEKNPIFGKNRYPCFNVDVDIDDVDWKS